MLVPGIGVDIERTMALRGRRHGKTDGLGGPSYGFANQGHFQITALLRPIRLATFAIALGFLLPLTDWFPDALPAADDLPSGTITWTNGDSLPGELTSANSSHMEWKSPVFQDAFVIKSEYVSSVRFPVPSPRAPKRDQAAVSFRFVLHNEDVLYGQVAKISKDSIVVDSPDHGLTSLDRSAVKSFRKLVSPSLTYQGPNGTAGWRTINAARRTAEWKAGPQGELSTRVTGAELFRAINLPSISEIDITLRWSGKPGFLITFATPSAIRLSKPTVKLETWDDELVLQTLRSNGDFSQIKTLTDDLKSIRLRLLWNQQTGELDVYSEFGEQLGKMRAGNEAQQTVSGLYIQNRGTDLTLEDVRVSSWDGAKPTAAGDRQGTSQHPPGRRQPDSRSDSRIRSEPPAADGRDLFRHEAIENGSSCVGRSG